MFHIPMKWNSKLQFAAQIDWRDFHDWLNMIKDMEDNVIRLVPYEQRMGASQ